MAASPVGLLTCCAQSRNWRSCDRPASSVIGSDFVRPGSLRTMEDGSPASRHSMVSVVRLSADILDNPATKRLSHFTRNLKFLYGSRRWVFPGNVGMIHSSFDHAAVAVFWLSFTTTNSAGRSGANPTR